MTQKSVSKNFLAKKIVFGQTFFWVDKILGQKIFELKETLSKENSGQKNFWI